MKNGRTNNQFHTLPLSFGEGAGGEVRNDNISKSNMRTKTITSFIIAALLLFSCDGNRNERNRASANTQHSAALLEYEEKFVEDLSSIVTIPLYTAVSNHNNNLSAVASDIEFVALSYDPPLPDVFHIRNIELCENHIFVSGLYFIYSFDRNGNFIQRIGNRGQGPQGFVRLLDIQLDRANQLLYAADINRRRMVVYRFDGTFEKAFPISGYNFKLLDPSLIAWHHTEVRRNPARLIEFMTNRGEVVKTLWSNNLPLPPSRERRHFGPEANPLWYHNDNFYFLEWGTDTIFRISGTSLEPVRVLTGNLKMSFDEHFLMSGVSGRNPSIAMPITRPNSGIFESNRFMIFRLSNSSERFFYGL